MKITLSIIFIIAFHSLFAQNETSNIIKLNDTTTFKNRFTIDIDFVSASFSYKRNISSKWKIGISAGIGATKKPVLNSLFIGDYELFSIGIPLQYQPAKLIYFDIEPRYAHLSDSHFNTENTLGIGTGVFVGGKLIQYGFKTMFGRTMFSNPDYFISNSLLVLRFLVVKW